MRIDVKIDPTQLLARTLREEKRVAYNAAQAMNQTALYGQRLIRAEITKNMTLRSNTKRGRSWLLEQVKVAFASVKRGLVFAEVYINTKPKRLLLAAFETPEQRDPFIGKLRGTPVTENARAGGSITGSILPGLTFKELRMKRRYVVPRSQQDRSQFKGAARTFLLKHTANAPDGGVFQRTGPGKGDIKELYEFKKPFRLRKLLHVTADVARAMREKFRIEWTIANAGNRK